MNSDLKSVCKELWNKSVHPARVSRHLEGLSPEVLEEITAAYKEYVRRIKWRHRCLVRFAGLVLFVGFGIPFLYLLFGVGRNDGMAHFNGMLLSFSTLGFFLMLMPQALVRG